MVTGAIQFATIVGTLHRGTDWFINNRLKEI